jgi:hypothetical protein
MYFLRARYLNTGTGRFWTMDTYEGANQDPGSLHKYLYVEADPVDNVDPCGHCLPSNAIWGKIVEAQIFATANQSMGVRLRLPGGQSPASAGTTQKAASVDLLPLRS